MDVGSWLRNLGLGQYETTFREAQIDADLLPELTEVDLEKLGVVLGHRKRLVRAIASLNATATANSAFAAADSAAERRQLTVMFYDMVGSTALATQLDPEDLSDVIRAFHDLVAAVVSRFDGHVAKLMGDGALVYFGYPRAHEDDAERAVRAALEVTAGASTIGRDRGVRLEARAGIATGLVVVGELVGKGESRERAVVGETPNLAARLQVLAEPGGVVISETTRRLLGAAFELNALGPQSLKGFAAPVPAWLVVREAENVSRFEASRRGNLTPFVGREQEVALLIDRWRAATSGEGQAVLLSGEAGIGKSRILEALREQIGGERHIVMQYQCSPHHANHPLYSIAEQIRHAAGFVSGELAATRLDKLEAMVTLSGLKGPEIVPFLAALLSVSTDGRYPALDMAPSEVRECTIATLIELFVGLTRSAPVLALWEDAHWIDPTSLDLFGRLMERLNELPVLAVVTFRPEFPMPWVGPAHVTAHMLSRLGRRQSLAMIEQLTGGKALPAEVLDEIIAKTDGVPLFIEELTKTVLESGLLIEKNGSYVVTAALAPLAIPSTLQDSLMARLDRLAPVREIAQIGATIGREFSYSLLQFVSPITGPALQDALRQLMASGLIYGRGTPPAANYVFKHALVQDTAYASLLRSRRQHIHADIARALAEHFTEQVEAAPETIARHYTEAGLIEPAVRSWLAAAEAALSRSANREGARYAETGLALIGQLPGESGHRELELSLQVVRANAALALKGYTAPDTIEILSLVKKILDSGIGTDVQRFSILYGLWAANYVAARIEIAKDLAYQYLEVANRQGDPTFLMISQRIVGAALIAGGQHRDGLRSLQVAYQHYDPARHRPLSYRFGQDIGLSVLCHEVWALWFMGRVKEAANLTEQILAELPSHGHATTIAFCTLYGAIFPYIFVSDFDRAASCAQDLVSYCVDRKMGPHYVVAGKLCIAVARGMHEPTAHNIEAIRSEIRALHQFGVYVLDSPISAAFAQIFLAAEDAEGADAVLEEAIAFAEGSGERYWLAELHRLKGRVASRRAAPHLAEVSIKRAIEIARHQEAISLELRAATDLVLLGHETSKAKDGLAKLLSVIGTDETSTEIRDARHLLRESKDGVPYST
jgi:class 3 adenylate cyclase